MLYVNEMIFFKLNHNYMQSPERRVWRTDDIKKAAQVKKDVTVSSVY